MAERFDKSLKLIRSALADMDLDVPASLMSLGTSVSEKRRSRCHPEFYWLSRPWH
jgi:hypothetical protein